MGMPSIPHDYEPGTAGEAPPGCEPVEASAWPWFLDALCSAPNTVGEVVPTGFEAYVRLPHPYWRKVGEGTAGAIYEPPEGPTTAGAWLRPVRESMADISAEGLWPPIDSAVGAPTVMAAVLHVLRSDFGNPECQCGFWSHGGASFALGGATVYVSGEVPRENWLRKRLARFVWRVRWALMLRRQRRANAAPKTIVLYRGRLDEVRDWLGGFASMMSHYPPPTAIWPEDRSWCIALPQNKPVSFVGGSRSLVEKICALPEIDAFEVERSDDVWRRG